MRHKWEYLTGNTWQCERCCMLRHVVQLPSDRAGYRYVEADVYSSDKGESWYRYKRKVPACGSLLLGVTLPIMPGAL